MIDKTKYKMLDTDKSSIDILSPNSLVSNASEFTKFLFSVLPNVVMRYGVPKYSLIVSPEGHDKIYEYNLDNGICSSMCMIKGFCKIYDKDSLEICINEWCILNYYKSSLYDTLIHEFVHYVQRSFPNIQLDFENIYELFYNLIKSKYMIERTEYDDSHKADTLLVPISSLRKSKGKSMFLDVREIVRQARIKNFSERLDKLFSQSNDYYTQTFEVSVDVDLSKHPEMNPKSHRADEYLPESLVDDLKSINVECKKTGFNDDKSKYTILEFEVEREPNDRLHEIKDFITNKLLEYGFAKDKISIVKWD